MDSLRDSVQADVGSLMSEIGTKAAPEEDYEDMPVAQRQPATEQDLYDDVYTRFQPQLEQSEKDQAADKEEDAWFDAYWDLHNAMLHGDSADVAEALGAWHAKDGDVTGLIEDVCNDLSNMDEQVDKLKQGLRRANVPYKAEIQDRLESLAQQLANIEAVTTGGQAQELPQQPVQKPDILSALTTTQTTRLPDGTVTTKVVLKQRFADGREETTESVHTSKEPAEQQVDEHKTVEKPKGKGWFWSES